MEPRRGRGRGRTRQTREETPAMTTRLSRGTTRGVKYEESVNDEDDGGDVEGATRCVCGSEADDISFMIQCNRCSCWQHGICVGIEKERACPDVYYCEVCRPMWHLPNGHLKRAHMKLRDDERSADDYSDTEAPDPPPAPEPSRKRDRQVSAQEKTNGQWQDGGMPPDPAPAPAPAPAPTPKRRNAGDGPRRGAPRRGGANSAAAAQNGASSHAPTAPSLAVSADNAKNLPMQSVVRPQNVSNLDWGLPDHCAHLQPHLPTPTPLPVYLPHYVKVSQGDTPPKDPAPELFATPESAAAWPRTIPSFLSPHDTFCLETIPRQPAKVKFPSRRITLPEMKKRVRGIMTYVSRAQIDISERDARAEAVDQMFAFLAARRPDGAPFLPCLANGPPPVSAEPLPIPEPLRVPKTSLDLMDELTKDITAFQRDFIGNIE